LVRSGKLPAGFMSEVVYASLGKEARRVKVGPGRGLDNGVVSAGGGRVLIHTADPVSAVPAFGMKLSAWLSVNLLASDFTTSGARPEYAVFSYDFPQRMSSLDAAEYIRSVGEECRELGVSIVGGHTGSYPGAEFTVIGAGWMFGFGAEGGYVTPAMARPGDVVVMTKHAAIEAAASLAMSFPGYTEGKVGARVARRASEMLRLCSTVAEAATASKVGVGREGVTSMHDATEGGVLGGLAEMAAASGHAFSVELERIPVTEEASAVCSAFGIDPLTSLGEGALLLTCRPRVAEGLLRRSRRSGIQATAIGTVGDGSGLWVSRKGRRARQTRPRADGYWRAYLAGVRSGLD
jgi:hydrogenase expression/formation protein HypE